MLLSDAACPASQLVTHGLQDNGKDPNGYLYKALDGTLSNLRWDLPTPQLQFYFTLKTNKNDSNGWDVLANFTRDIAGGGSLRRSLVAFDVLNLPEVQFPPQMPQSLLCL